MENCSYVMVILQENRSETAVKVQDVLTKYGCFIRVRLGLHESGVDQCTNHGLIMLQLCGPQLPIDEFQAALTAIAHVKVKIMNLDF